MFSGCRQASNNLLLKQRWRIVFASLFLLLPIERILVLKVDNFTIRPVYFIMLALIFKFLGLRHLHLQLKTLAFAILVGIVALTSVGFSFEPRISFLYSLWALFTIVFSVVAVAILRSFPPIAELWLFYYIRSGTLWSLVIVAQWLLAFRYPVLAYSFLGDYPRVHGLMLEPSYLATFLTFPFFLAVGRKKIREAVLIGLALVLSTSRTGVVAIAFGFMILVVFKMQIRVFVKLKNVVLLSAFVFASVLAISSLSQTRSFFSAMFEFTYNGLLLQDVSSAIPRLKSWRDAYDTFLAHPFTGVGLGAYGYALAQTRMANLDSALEGSAARSLKTANLILEILAEMGIQGLFVLMLWVLIPLWNLSRCSYSSPGFAVLVGFVTLIFTLPFIQTWWRPYLWLPWVLGVGYVCRR